MSYDAAEGFRITLSDTLRAAMVARDRDAVRALRSVMAAIDNAGAVTPPAGTRDAAAPPTEVPRRPLSANEIAAILQAEIATRSRNAGEYERRGNAAQAAELRSEIATLQPLTALLPSP